MAKFTDDGLDGLMLSLQELAELPDDVEEEMLDDAARVVVGAHRRQLRALGLWDPGNAGEHLVDSITAHKKVETVDGVRKRSVLIYPTGKRAGSKTIRRGRKGRAKPVEQNDVGFVHEFGAPKRGIPAKNWMQKANDLCAPDVEKAEFEVYDRWAQSKDL